MTHDFAPGVTSVSSNALLFTSVVDVLEQVEQLPSGSSGALAFGNDGVIFIENRRICWAVANDMRPRLTDLLCSQRKPPLERAQVEQVFRRCQQQGKPLGEALVDEGLVSEGELRAVLERHTCEALVRIAQGEAKTCTGFDRHRGGGYQPRFVFGAAELLASLAGRRREQLASKAREVLAQKLVPETHAFAFLREPAARDPVLIAVDRRSELSVAASLAIARWLIDALEIAAYAGAPSTILSATWCASMSLVAWRQDGVHFAALCASRPASARLLARLASSRQEGT